MAEKQRPVVEAPLSVIEAIPFDERVYSTFFLTIKSPEGVDPDQLENALVAVANRHPMLHSKKEKRDGITWITNDIQDPMPLIVIERQDEDTWRTVVANEFKKGFNSNSCRWKVILLQGRESVEAGERTDELLIIADHGTMDGISHISVVNDILKKLANPNIELEPLEYKGIMGNLAGLKYRTLAPIVEKALEVISWTVWTRVGQEQWNKYLELNQEADYETFDVNLTTEETKRLLNFVAQDKNGNERKIPVMGMLMAAFAQAFHEVHRDGKKEAKLYVPFNVRNQLPGITEVDLGLFTGIAMPSVPLDTDIIEASFQAKKNLDTIIGIERILNKTILMSAIKSGGITRQDVSAVFPIVPNYYAILSNLGKPKIPYQIGKYKVSNFRASTLGSPYEVAGLVMTDQDQLRITFTHRVPPEETNKILTPDQVRNVANRIIEILRGIPLPIEQ